MVFGFCCASSAMADASHSSDVSDSEDNTSSHEFIIRQIAIFTEALEQNPADYTSRLELIKFLRLKPDFEALEEQRNELASRFPLQDDVWIQWLADKEKIAFNEMDEDDDLPDDEALQGIVDLYERALKDYLSVDIWLSYVSFLGNICIKSASLAATSSAMDVDLELPKSSIANVDRVRATYERALETLQYHVHEAYRIWNAYRQFEANYVLQVNSDPDETVATELQKKLGTLFRRQLGQPALTMEQTMATYKDFLDGEEVTCHAQFDKAKELLAERMQFESQLMESTESVVAKETGSIQPPDYNKLSIWWSYIKLEESKKNPPVGRVKCVYERALKKFYLIPELWKAYASFMYDTHKNDIPALCEFYERAVRNYPYSSWIWIEYMATFERAKKPKEDMDGLLQRALTSGITSHSDYVDLYTAYAIYLQKQITDWTDAAAIQPLKDVISYGVEFLQQSSPDHAHELRKILVEIEEENIKDIAATRAIYEAGINPPKSAATFLDFIQFELRHNEVEKARSLFKRAVQANLDQPDLVAFAFKRFEGKHGTTEARQEIQHRIAKKLAGHAIKSYVQAAASAGVGVDDESDVDTHAQKNRNRDDKSSKKKRGRDEYDETAPNATSKRRKERGEDWKDNQSAAQDSHGPLGEWDPYAAQLTGLPVEALSHLSEAETHSIIKTMLQGWGEVTSVRLPKDNHSGNYRGFAFVEFKLPQSVTLLLDKDPKLEFVVPVKATDKMDTDGEPSGPVTAILKVKRAKRPIVKGADNKKAPNAGPYEGEKRKFSDENTIFLKNLAFKADESALRAFISATSKVVPKEVRIPVDAHGKSKGIAYVECEKSEDVPTLIADLDNKDLMGLNVKAEKSNPTRPRAKLVTPAPVSMMVPRNVMVRKQRVGFGSAVARQTEAKRTPSGDHPH